MSLTHVFSTQFIHDLFSALKRHHFKFKQLCLNSIWFYFSARIFILITFIVLFAVLGMTRFAPRWPPHPSLDLTSSSDVTAPEPASLATLTNVVQRPVELGQKDASASFEKNSGGEESAPIPKAKTEELSQITSEPPVQQTKGKATAENPVYINSASETDFRRLPGVGAKRASALVALRTKRGGKFSRVEDLLRVKGIGKKTLAKWRAIIKLE